MMTMMFGLGAADREEVDIHEKRTTIAGINLARRWCSMVISEYRKPGGVVVFVGAHGRVPDRLSGGVVRRAQHSVICCTDREGIKRLRGLDEP
jgi:hypothetical protein